MSKESWKKRITVRLFHRNIQLTRKKLVICLAIVVVPITISLILYSIYSASTMENEIFRNMQVTVAQAKNNVDYRMEQVEENSMSILTTVYPYLSSTGSTADQLNEYRELTRLFAEFQGHHMISKLRLYVPNSKVYSTQDDTFYSLENLLQDNNDNNDERSLLLERGNYWLETQDRTLTFGVKPVSAISCVTTISSTTNYEEIVGVLFLDVGVSQLNSMLSSGIDESESLFLVNANGTVLAHSNASLISTDAFYETPDFNFDKVSDSQTLMMSGEKKLMVYSKLNIADWYLVMTVPYASVFSFGFFSLDMVRIAIILLIIASFVVAMILTYTIVAESTILRINSAINTLKTQGIRPLAEQQGSVTIVKRKNKPNSLATLEQNTNRMVMTIKALLDHQYQNEIAVRDYQLHALQAQINPHFLYNTLDIIKWMVVDGKTEDSVFMVNALSKYFQQSLSKGKDIVRIEEEISLTKTYLGIMKKRFQNKFSAEFSVNPDALNCLIPKLSLQPLVENALLHGILYTEKLNPVLSVRVVREGDFICIDIEDNGDGMDEDSLIALQTASKPGKSYGIFNVRERLELFGTDSSGLEISSKKGFGTCISLKLLVQFES